MLVNRSAETEASRTSCCESARPKQDFKQIAINDGVSPDVVDSALTNAKFDPSVLAHDHLQAGLQGNYTAFAVRHITPGRIKRGKTMLVAYAEPLERIE